MLQIFSYFYLLKNILCYVNWEIFRLQEDERFLKHFVYLIAKGYIDVVYCKLEYF